MRKLKLGEVKSPGQGQVDIKWQSWNLTKFPLYLKPCALNHSSFSESALLPLNCCLFKLCVWKKSASQYLNCSRWRVHHFCFSAFVFTTIKRRNQASQKQSPVTLSLHFSWADWELAHSLINPHVRTVFKWCTMLQNNTSLETGCCQWARG